MQNKKTSQVEVGGFGGWMFLMSCPRWWFKSAMTKLDPQTVGLVTFFTEKLGKSHESNDQTKNAWTFSDLSMFFLQNCPFTFFGSTGQLASWRWWTPSTFLGHLEMDIFMVSFAEYTQYSNKKAIDLSKLLNGPFILGGRQDGLATYFLSTKASKTKNARFLVTIPRQLMSLWSHLTIGKGPKVSCSPKPSLSFPKSWSMTYIEWKQNLTKSITPQWNDSPKWIS